MKNFHQKHNSKAYETKQNRMGADKNFGYLHVFDTCAILHLFKGRIK